MKILNREERRAMNQRACVLANQVRESIRDELYRAIEQRKAQGNPMTLEEIASWAQEGVTAVLKPCRKNLPL